jgi:uracil-DNA glycosylase family 4
LADNRLLRAYLRQLRQMGESELTFGALASHAVRNGFARGEASPSVSASALHMPPASGAQPTVQAHDELGSQDWRATLLAADAGKREPSGSARKGREAAKPASSPPARSSARKESAAAADTPVKRKADSTARDAGGIVVDVAAADMFAEAGAFANLDAITEAVRGCTRCPLHRTAKNAVPGEGNARAELFCVGEGPGEKEDESGRPFVGAAGKLLVDILAAINLAREQVFISNVVKHRPPGNRTPLPDEISACQPYLVRQLELVRPRVILALGTTAAQTLLATRLPLGKLRGTVHRYNGIPLVVTYHPAALLRNPSWKRPTWEDVQLVRSILDGKHGT